MSDIRATVRVLSIRAALPFAAKRDPRDYLKAVAILPSASGSLVVATNGTVAIIIHDEFGDTTAIEYPIPLLTGASLDRVAIRDWSECGRIVVRSADCDGKRLAHWETPLGLLPDKIRVGDTYPDIAKILPERSAAEPLASYDPMLFGRFERVARIFNATVCKGNPKDKRVTMQVHLRRDAPTCCELQLPRDSGISALYIIMPMAIARCESSIAAINSAMRKSNE